MKIKKSKLISNAYLFIIGFLGLSMMGQYIVLNVLHIPFSFMELYYIPLIYVYRNRIARFIRAKFLRQSLCQVLLNLFLLTGIGIGIIYTAELSFILEYRSIIYFMLIFSYVKKYDVPISLKQLYFVNISALLGELLYITQFTTSTVTSSVNCVAISIAILTAFIQENYTHVVIAFVCSCLLGIVSGFRIGIIVAVICFVMGMIHLIIRRDSKNKRKTIFKRQVVLGITVAVLCLAIMNYKSIINLVASITGMSAFAIFRVTDRMINLLSGDFTASQDVGRLALFRHPLNRFVTSLLPRGLIGSKISEYWLYIDMPILYLYDLFGSLASYAILFYLLSNLGKKTKYILMKEDKALVKSSQYQLQVLAVMLSPVLLLLFLVNGSFLVIVFQSIETAFLLGLLTTNINRVKTIAEIKKGGLH